MSAGHLRLGREGEEAAARLLASRGLVILERNFRCRTGEVDLVCGHGGTLVFVEVKTRAETSLAAGTDAVDRRKRSRIVTAAAAYLSMHGLWERPCRFDVVSVVKTAQGLAAQHIPDAFRAEQAPGNGWQPW